MDIDAMYQTVSSGDTVELPYGYQRALALDGLPELIDVPTGCGKTKGAMLAWVYRRFRHPDPSVRYGTPTRSIWCLPLRTLTYQTAQLAKTWIEQLGLADAVDVLILMGGEPVEEQRWRLEPHRPTIIVSTLDMALSRALNRGYRAGRFAWPIDFALFNDDCHWVFDEVQLMGAALPTSRQLHGLRSILGVPTRHNSTWMSATVDRDALCTVDASTIDRVIELSDADRNDARLAQRLAAPKVLTSRRVDDPKRYAVGMADIVRAEHVEGTTTLVVINSVKTAQELAKRLRREGTEDGASIELLHSRFRRPDRDAALHRVLSGPPNGAGRVIVSTQVIEAGVDLSSTTLITECAPWSSIVQRSGRCNRWGESEQARVLVVESSKATPYEERSVEAAWAAVNRMDGMTVTADVLASERVGELTEPSVVLRRKDLIELFDTTPDLSGNDIDVSRFIRADGNLDVSVVWRSIDDRPPRELEPPLSRDEVCPVPISEARTWITKIISGASRALAIIFDASTAEWRRVQPADVRPGALIVVDSSVGGYNSLEGFSSSERSSVEVLATDRDEGFGAGQGGSAEGDLPTVDDDHAAGDDALTTDVDGPMSLVTHLADAEAAAVRLCDELGITAEAYRAAICEAARLHDLGKAHPAFQQALHEAVRGQSTLDSESTDVSDATAVSDTTVLAKSGTNSRLRYEPDRRGLRHELVSALILLQQPELIRADAADPDLVTYLVGAHHGRIRLGARPLVTDGPNAFFGVHEGDVIEPVDLGGGLTSARSTLSIDVMTFGGDGRSWTAMASDLLTELGPFRLAWLEALVRIADWRASIRGEQS